jgi:tight adherence protein B
MNPAIYKLLAYISTFAGIFYLVLTKSDRFFDWLRFQSVGERDQITELLNQMFIQIPSQKVLQWMLSASCGAGFLILLICLPSILKGLFWGFVAGIIVWKAPLIVVKRMARNRLSLFVLQMVDGLNLVTNGLRSGLSLVQSIGLLVEQMPNPISQEFNFVLNENKLGVAIDEALENLTKRVPADDVKMFVTSIVILRETGGNLSEVFDTITQTIRDRIKVENRISTLVAGAYNQGMTIMMMPAVMGGLFYMSDPDSMSLLFNKPLGWAVLACIMALETIGYLFIVRIVTIEV